MSSSYLPRISRRTRTFSSGVLCVLAGGLVAGCGSSSSSPPTATPAPPKPAATATPIIVTATPNPASHATANPATPTTKVVKVVQVVVTATPRLPPKAKYTPQPTGGVVTPVPHATPVPSAPGLKLGMITRPLSTVQTIQTEVNNGNTKYLYYLHPTQVVQKNLAQEGFRPPIDVVSPAKPVRSYSGRPVQKADVKYDGTLYEVYLAQPLTRGPKGIWVIVTILRQHLKLGEITRPLRVVARLQHLADTGNKNYAFYRNPTQVITKGLPQYGFVPPFSMVQAPHSVPSPTGRPLQRAQINYQGDLYVVDVAQPVTRGPKGVWVIVTILRAS